MASGRMIVGVILGLIGLFYAAMPHSVHISTGLDFGLSHTAHMIIGVVLIIIGIVLIMRKKM